MISQFYELPERRIEIEIEIWSLDNIHELLILCKTTLYICNLLENEISDFGIFVNVKMLGLCGFFLFLILFFGWYCIFVWCLVPDQLTLRWSSEAEILYVRWSLTWRAKSSRRCGAQPRCIEPRQIYGRSSNKGRARGAPKVHLHHPP